MKKIILKTAKKKETGKKGGGIFYAILFVTIVTVGTTAYVMRARNDALTELAENRQPQVASTTPDTTPIQVVTIPDEFSDEESTALVEESQWQSDDVVPVTETPEPVNTDDAEESTHAPEEIPEITSLITPVNGNVIKPHSDTELSYSKTMEDWRLHKGVDIGAPIGATVIASGKGEISECYTDTATGVTIIIDHGNGLMTKYSNMASAEMVEIGQQVESGTVIGVVGDTAEFEVADEAHIHFEVIKDGRSVNPEEYFK